MHLVLDLLILEVRHTDSLRQLLIVRCHKQAIIGKLANGSGNDDLNTAFF